MADVHQSMDPNTRQSILQVANVISYAEKTLRLTTKPGYGSCDCFEEDFFISVGLQCNAFDFVKPRAMYNRTIMALGKTYCLNKA